MGAKRPKSLVRYIAAYKARIKSLKRSLYSFSKLFFNSCCRPYETVEYEDGCHNHDLKAKRAKNVKLKGSVREK